jgi:hypothetical protein
MANSYIPRSDAGAVTWMKAFAGGLVANPARYMLTPGQAAVISETVDEFVAAWSKANCPETRTKSAVSEKDQTRNSAEDICRQYYSLIKINAGISDQAKIDIGVRPENRCRIPIKCPQSSPLLNTIGCTPGRQVLCYHDSSTPDSCAKPFGATELQLFVAISDKVIADRSEAKLVGKFTRNPISVGFEPEDGGKRATYYARWVSRRGETGPWSLPVSMHIAA